MATPSDPYSNHPTSPQPHLPPAPPPSSAPPTQAAHPPSPAPPQSNAKLDAPTETGNETGNETFKYPPHHAFPPFYTLQPNHTTRASQLASWSSLLTAYCAHHTLYRLTPTASIFTNTRLSRTLAPDDAREVLSYMVSRGRAEWIASSPATTGGTFSRRAAHDKDKERQTQQEAWIWYRLPSQWANLIATWVEETGQRNTVLTFYELFEGEVTMREEFHGLPGEMARVAVGVLVKRGRAVVFGGTGGGLEGVKFFG